MSSSRLYKGEVILDDSTSDGQLMDMMRGFERGYEPEGRPEGYGYGSFAAKFDSDLLIPESEWQARIQEAEQQGSRISDILTRLRIPHKDQGSTNFCWANGPCHAAETLRAIQNLPYVSLSPASVAAPITGFRNVGGWGLEAVKRAREVGFVPSRLWPDNAIERRYQTSAAIAEAARYRFREWTECKPRSKAESISMAIRGMPGSLGFNWWGHLVMGCEAVWLDGEVALRIRNSWRGWGANGFGILRGAKMLADDAVYPVSVRASAGGAKGAAG